MNRSSLACFFDICGPFSRSLHNGCCLWEKTGEHWCVKKWFSDKWASNAAKVHGRVVLWLSCNVSSTSPIFQSSEEWWWFLRHHVTSSMPKAATRAVLQKNSTAEKRVASDFSFGTWNFRQPSKFCHILHRGCRFRHLQSIQPVTAQRMLPLRENRRALMCQEMVFWQMNKQCSKSSWEGRPMVVLQCVLDISNLSKFQKMMLVFEAPCHQFNAKSSN